MEILKLIDLYNPWWSKGEGALDDLPTFERPVLADITQGLSTQPQILSITGPRRVGKTTLLRQLVRHLLRQGVARDRLVYYSLDDPALFRPKVKPARLIDALMNELQKRAGNEKVYLFLDEIQRLERWELYLKKYYDLNYPLRFVISGSASSPIFKKSRESLLGRVKDFHVLPFSFREFLLYKLRDNSELTAELEAVRAAGASLMGALAGDPKYPSPVVFLHELSNSLWEAAQTCFTQYVQEGGFPEVWNMPTWEQKVDYLYDNQVKKVIYEDLVLAVELRKPEQLKRFYISLLEKPGREVNLSAMARETGVGLQQLDKYLPWLEMTDLVSHIERFRKSPLRVRRGNVKFYLVDLALRNAVLRLRDEIESDPAVMGTYAENLVFNALRKWRGTIALDYYRDRDGEVDFVVHTQPERYLPVEVKHRESVTDSDLEVVRRVTRRFGMNPPLVVVKRREDFGWRGDVAFLPLLHFLLLFD